MNEPVRNELYLIGSKVATTPDWLEPAMVPFRNPVMVIGDSFGVGLVPSTFRVVYVSENGVWL